MKPNLCLFSLIAMLFITNTSFALKCEQQCQVGEFMLLGKFPMAKCWHRDREITFIAHPLWFDSYEQGTKLCESFIQNSSKFRFKRVKSFVSDCVEGENLLHDSNYTLSWIPKGYSNSNFVSSEFKFVRFFSYRNEEEKGRALLACQEMKDSLL